MSKNKTNKFFWVITVFITCFIWGASTQAKKVFAANTAPIVNAGPDKTTTTNGVNLGGSITDDGLPYGILMSSWSQVSGPGIATIVTPSSPTTVVMLPALGAYTFRLGGTDGQLTGVDYVTITYTINKPPTVNAGPDRAVTLINGNANIVLSGTASDDGLPYNMLTTRWSQLSGPGKAIIVTATTTSTNVIFSVPGTYVFRLMAGDTASIVSDDVQVTVSAALPPVNKAPAVNAGPDKILTLVNGSASTLLSGTVSDDGLPQGILTSNWTKLSGPAVFMLNATNPTATIVFSATGTYTFQLTASDSVLSASDTVIVTVNSSTAPINKAPVVDAGPDQQVTRIPGTVSARFAGKVSDDGLPFGILSARWTQLSGSTATILTATNTTTSVLFSQGGVYTFQLMATDGQLTTTDTMQITVVNSTTTPIVTLATVNTSDVIQPGSRTIVRGNSPGKIIFRTPEAGPTTVYLYERGTQTKSIIVDSIVGNNEIDIQKLRSDLNLTWGIYYLTLQQNGKILKKNVPLALIP